MVVVSGDPPRKGQATTSPSSKKAWLNRLFHVCVAYIYIYMSNSLRLVPLPTSQFARNFARKSEAWDAVRSHGAMTSPGCRRGLSAKKVLRFVWAQVAKKKSFDQKDKKKRRKIRCQVFPQRSPTGGSPLKFIASELASKGRTGNQRLAEDGSTTPAASFKGAHISSLPEFMNFKFFGKTILVVNIKFRLFLGHPLGK